MLSELYFWTVAFYRRQTWQREVWHSYSIKDPKKQYLKRKAHGGCFLICKIISRHYKKSDSDDGGSFMNSSCLTLIVCPLFGNSLLLWKKPSYAPVIKYLCSTGIITQYQVRKFSRVPWYTTTLLYENSRVRANSGRMKVRTKLRLLSSKRTIHKYACVRRTEL